jgi:cytochrome P450
MDRLTTEPFTFSDGTHLPTGNYVYAAAASIHTDENNYPNATQFDPFRFATLREEDSQNTKNHLVSTATDYIPFGHGKHSWYISFSKIILYLAVSYHFHIVLVVSLSLMR